MITWEDIPITSSMLSADGKIVMLTNFAPAFFRGNILIVSPPVITAQPAAASINSGASATLTVTAEGTSLLYQWYAGTRGDVTSPIVNATAATLLTGPLTTNGTFWVRISNNAGKADSVAVDVILNPLP